MTIDYTSDIGRVRLLISDVDPENLVLTDDMVQGYLALEDGNIRLAAAEALDAIASSEALLSKKIRTQDRESDGPAVAAELRKHAAALRARAAAEAEADEPFFMLISSSSGRNEGEEYR